MNNDLAAFVTYILLRLIQLGIIILTVGIFVEAIL
jgi:hypothetical protein